MVKLTQTLFKYIPDWYHLQRSSSGFFRKQSLFYMTRYYRNIGWSTRKNSINRYHYFLKGENYWFAKESAARRDHNRSRIAAACDEHGYKYQYLISTLPKLDINLNLYSLSRLAIYEPKTFKSLIDICRAITNDDLPAIQNETLLEQPNFKECL